MTFDPLLGAIRFGTGLSPHHEPPPTQAAIMDRLAGPDTMATALPIAPFSVTQPSMVEFVRLRRASRNEATEAGRADAEQQISEWRIAARQTRRNNALATIGRSLDAPLGLRERLTAFWADHFTVKGRNALAHHMITPFVEEAIRPHITGSFRDMLRAVATHPMMLLYLQQTDSHGPNSPRGLRRERGLNENLARELMELHSLGVGSDYTQTDVRELAELLTGLTFSPANGFKFDTRMAEPGSETVLGVNYGPKATLQTIHSALDNLALHPDTAEHIARKLAVHFVSDTPDAGLVEAMAQSFQQTEGDLQSVLGTMIDHPAAWAPGGDKVRPPIEFITASLRALGLRATDIKRLEVRDYQRLIIQPLRVMGQPWETPVGPDGWPEAAQDWIIPQAMAGRINWAMRMPREFVRPLPDPRDFVRTALGDRAPPSVVFAATAAESRADGIGVILASPAFQRR
ncbi:Uncharacterized conserved protein, DUF1800 family [Cognatiyoonia koreensis]|uniref:Uncharacterized conserved protein, DUF1800 family n=1 Tax=Cognatiyoonia koreensis TaxID=364200 RepID=A0A1I0N2I7_9RHOB|nr:DUF1800 domain-containing protein [Cognatiyoonia koreensis]SEV95262.1 Uncharacterized conserved protein, DUF1800 family [Cognatiyoonia koreensis]